MKKFFLLGLFFVLAFSSQSFAARVPIPYCSGCEYLVEVADLPDTEEYYSEEYKAYVDLGYFHKQFWLVWLPVWNYDGKYCLHIKGNEEVYFDLTEEELNEYAKTNNIKLSASPISLWNKLGGKVIFGGLILLAIYGYFSKDDDEAEEGNKKEEEDTNSGPESSSSEEVKE